MEIFTDHFYEKGHNHLVCQDYALSQLGKDYAFFVVSDGCGSAPNSEVGSMVLANAFKATYESLWSDELDLQESEESIRKNILRRANEVRQSLELLPESLFATLLFGCYDRKSCTFQLAAWGDGLFILLFEDGSYEVIEIECSNNAPFYIAYDASPFSKQQFIESFGGKMATSTYGFNANGTRLYKNDYFYGEPKMITFPHLKSEKKLCGVLGFSDGLKSFDEHFLSLAGKCIDYRKINATFIERRMKRVLKEKQKAGDLPYDDVSCAGIVLK